MNKLVLFSVIAAILIAGFVVADEIIIDEPVGKAPKEAKPEELITLKNAELAASIEGIEVSELDCTTGKVTIYKEGYVNTDLAIPCSYEVNQYDENGTVINSKTITYSDAELKAARNDLIEARVKHIEDVKAARAAKPESKRLSEVVLKAA